MRVLGCLVGVLCGLMMQAAAVADEPVVRLFGDREAGQVRLLWRLQKWPADVDGFVVKRHAADAGHGAWIIVTKTPVYAELTVDHDWSTADADAQRQAFLREETQRRLSSGQMRGISRADFQALAKKEGERLFMGLWAECVRDYTFALLDGFGVVDRLPPDAGAQVYGLFAWHDGKAGDAPLAQCLVKLYDEKEQAFHLNAEVTVSNQGEMTELNWAVPVEQADALGVYAVHLERAPLAEPTKRVRLTTLNPLGFARTEDGKRTGFFPDRGVQAGQTYVYSVIPVTSLGRLLPRIEVQHVYRNEVTPAYYPYPPDVKDLKQDTTTAATLTWEFNVTDLANISGFRVERQDASGTAFKPVATVAANVKVAWQDQALPAVGSTVTYRVVALGKKAGDRVSYLKSLDVKKLVRLSAPKGLKFKEVQDQVNSYAVLTWDKASDEEQAFLAGYTIYSDLWKEGEMDPHNGVPTKETTFRESINTKGRGYAFRVCAVHVNGEISAPAEVSTYQPLKAMPEARLRRYYSEDNGKIRWVWNYPDDIRDLTGFRIFRDGKQVAGEAELGPTVREWRMDALAPGQSTKLQIQAVSKFGFDTLLSVEKVYAPVQE